MYYRIKITANNGSQKDIFIDGFSSELQNSITSLKIWTDTTNENVSERSADILNKVEIKILINNKTKDYCKDLMEWSLDRSGGDIYRLVHIDVATVGGTGTEKKPTTIRSFDIEQMFVEDYIEEYGKGNGTDAGEATLKLIQAANYSDKFLQDSCPV